MLNRKAIVSVLMRRDGYSREDAIEEVKGVAEEMQEYINMGDYEGAIEVLESYGFEPDYIC